MSIKKIRINQRSYPGSLAQSRYAAQDILSMNYQSEFQRITNQLRSDWENYKRYYPDAYDVLNSLVNLSVYLKVKPDSYDVLDRISKFLLSITADDKLFSSSPICPELRELLTKFDAHISSKLELGNTEKQS